MKSVRAQRKHILLTVASSGLGKAFVFQLTRYGSSKIILSQKDKEKLNIVPETYKDIANSYGHSTALIEVIACDLSDSKDFKNLGNEATHIYSPRIVDMQITMVKSLVNLFSRHKCRYR